MKRLFLITVLIAFIHICKAQTIGGLVKDAKTNAPLAYVNVGVIGKSTGTVTDTEGKFNLTLNNNNTDSLRVSMVGYIPQTFYIADVVTNTGKLKNLLLQPAIIPLKEVKVSNHKWKQVVLGNTTKSKSTDAGFDGNRLGHEIGTIIKIKKSPTYLKQFNAAIAVPPSDSVKLRLNFYTLKDGKPDQLLQHENIFISVKKGQDYITVNLEPYYIVVEDKFFVSLEWIQNSRGHGVMFSASILSGSIISRETSQANWEKVGIAGLGFNVLAEY